MNDFQAMAVRGLRKWGTKPLRQLVRKGEAQVARAVSLPIAAVPVSQANVGLSAPSFQVPPGQDLPPARVLVGRVAVKSAAPFTTSKAVSVVSCLVPAPKALPLELAAARDAAAKPVPKPPPAKAAAPKLAKKKKKTARPSAPADPASVLVADPNLIRVAEQEHTVPGTDLPLAGPTETLRQAGAALASMRAQATERRSAVLAAAAGEAVSPPWPEMVSPSTAVLRPVAPERPPPGGVRRATVRPHGGGAWHALPAPKG